MSGELIDVEVTLASVVIAPLTMNGEPSKVFDPVHVLFKGSKFVPAPIKLVSVPDESKKKGVVVPPSSRR